MNKISRRYHWKSPLKQCIAVLFTALFAVTLYSPVLATDSQDRVLRVAFPQIKGITETGADGSRHGLVVDYLNEIAKYTGWKYEYIDTTSEALVDGFIKGQYDLLGGNYYSPGFEKYFAYPDYNIGYSKAVLLARQDNYSIQSNNLESINGKTIGVYDRAKENIRRLQEFLSANNLDCTLKYYSIDQLSSDGDLYSYLESGETDLVLGNELENADGLKTVTSFNSQPLYLVTTVGNQEILDGLNMALSRITDANPNFAAECYAKNFPDALASDVYLNQKELAYIGQKETVSVAVPDNWHPLFCLDSTDDSHNGVIPDLLNEITAYSGLRFTYVYAPTYIEAIQLVKDGKADMLGFFLGTEEEANETELVLTAPYINLNSIIVRNKASSYPGTGLTGAAIEGRKIPDDILASTSKALYYPHIRDALSAVNRGEADFMYGISARMERDIQRYQFNNLIPVTLVNDRVDCNFALPQPVDPDLLTIMNKALTSLSNEKKADILNRNLISIGAGSLSLRDFIYANPLLFISVLSLILLILVIAVLLVNRSRTKAALMQSSLKRAEAENLAKGEFLSRMSHEIRTPMNAIMGLVDLMSLKKNVPDDLREDLAKIRSSSRYLLNLINDILDMSRIGNGMLSIAKEPFSLECMIDEIQSMLESEAQRRKLDYTLKKEITHSWLAGDVIRLRQVLTNLLSNAFKFTPAGGAVQLQITETSSSSTEATFFFQVADNGPGIAPEDQQRIFESFEQLGTNYSKSQGTGLGLSISSKIVQLMGGSLQVKSKPEKGSAFYFTITLPYSLAENTSKKEDTPNSEDRLLEGAHILLAEDNDLNAEIAVQLLEIQGAILYRCENGRKAVERFAASKPDEFQIILMDIQMPEMNGLEATQAIRAMDRTDAASIPVIAMTANSFQEDVNAAMAAGMNGFISKPLDVNYLYQVLGETLKDGQEQQ